MNAHQSAAVPLPEADSLLSEAIKAGDFPSASYLVAEKGEIRFRNAIGNAVVTPREIPAKLDTIYDLASLTKPLSTALLCAQSVQSGELSLETRVSDVLPEFSGSDKQGIQVKHLLTHTAGLPAWLPLYIVTGGDVSRTAAVIAGRDLISTPGKKVTYSDLGFILLGSILEHVSGQNLALLATERIFTPLGLRDTCFNPPDSLLERIAASETGNAYERDMCSPDQASAFGSGWRSDVVWGQVHDGNAWFLGGAAGHAGLFSNADETLEIASQFLANRSRLLTAETCRSFTTDVTPGLEESRSYGWQMAATPESTAGKNLPPSSFGHNGFTGTCCWVDPFAERVYILLTNRTHARALPFVNINSTRRVFNSRAALALQAV